MKKILIVEDEPKLARFLQLELKHEGYVAETATDGNTGYEMASTGDYDLVLLDVMLPGKNGLDICKDLRDNGNNVPIIMLTAKDDISDKVAGLDIGADDYMTKPFATEELLARIRVVFKKPVAQSTGNFLKAGPLVLDKSKYEVTYNDKEIALTKKEFELLQYLMENRNIALTREQIVENVWNMAYDDSTNVTDVYIKYLRSKIDEVYGTHYIKTSRGIGYIFETEE